MIAGLILAAGESSRMGRDKALLPFGQSTFLAHLVELFLRHVAPVVVVLGHNAERIGASVEPRAGLAFTINPEYGLGQLSSLQAGLRALPPEATAALVTLVDHPAVAASTIRRVLQESGAPLVIPRYRGRRGHPVLFARPVIAELLELPPESSAKQVVHARLAEAVQVEVEDPGVVRDVDTPADYEDLLSAVAASADPRGSGPEW